MKSRFAKIAYGVGNLGQALFFNTVQTFLIFFYTDVVRLDPGLVGLAFAISYGVWNAINDPLVGLLSDRTRTRWGRRIPYIALGWPLTFILFVLIWSPPLGGSPLTDPSNTGIFIYFAVVIALFDLAYTGVSVAYTAIFPEAFEDLGERTEVSIYRQVAAMVGTALGMAVMPIVVGALSERFGALGGWTGAGLILGLVGGGAFGFSLLGSRERKEVSEEEALPLTAAFKETFTNRSFLAFVGANLMICYVWSWLSAMVPFFTKYAIGAEEEQMSLIFVGMFVTSMAFYPLWRKIALRLGSKRTLALAVTLFVVFMLPVLFVADLPQAFVMMLFVGAANSGITLVRDIVLSDVIDEDELRTGRRREGSYFGVNAFIERLVMVLIGGSTSLVLGLSGYDAELATQPPSVALGIRLGMGLLPVVALVVFLAALRFYPLGKEQVVALRDRLEVLHREKIGQQKRGLEDTLS
ncbi:MAG: MFS transporter [Chloroflexota bacterium]|nr:MFS transporter [Chloroflexota bacterium]